MQIELTAAGLRADAAFGLTDTPKWLPSEWFSGARDSELLERIAVLPLYCPTRVER